MKLNNNYQDYWKSMGLLFPLLLTGCSDELSHLSPTDVDGRQKIELGATIDQVNDTRADESGFADGDKFGVFVVNYDGDAPGQLTLTDNQANNVAFTYSADDNKWQASTDIYWHDNVTPADVYGYYPFNNGMGDVDAYRFEVEHDQSIAKEGEMGHYEASDLLWAKASRAVPGKKVSLTFNHILAGVKVTLQQGEGFDGDSWSKLTKRVTVDNTIRTAGVDLSKGTATPNGELDRNVVMNPESGDTYRAVVVPQSVASGKNILSITIDGVSYQYKPSAGMIYTAGKLHNFTMKVDRKSDGSGYSLTLVSEEITPWEADKTSHDFESNSYLVINVPVAGTLKECIKKVVKEPELVKNLKITGTLTESDFEFIRNEMSLLKALNIKSVKMADITKDIWEFNPSSGEDERITVTLIDELPEDALRGLPNLTRIILPESLKSIGKWALAGLTLESDLILPDSITVIKKGAFRNLKGDISVNIPKSIVKIGEDAFAESSVRVSLQFPKNLKHIGSRAFYYCEYAEGTFNLPENLEYLGEEAFHWCGHISKKLTGDIVIPIKIKKIPNIAFYYMGFQSGTNLKLHDGVTEIGASAFARLSFSSPISFPESIKIIGGGAFGACSLTGEIRLPDNISHLGDGAFANTNMRGHLTLPSGLEEIGSSFSNTLIDKVTFGNNIIQIKEYACNECNELQYIEIGKNVELIDDFAFTDCPQLKTVVCLSSTPPSLGDNVFNGIDPNHCVLEVPENYIENYRHDSGWKIFSNITPHHELGLSTTEINALNKGIIRNVMVRAEDEWEVTECPSWIHVTPDQAIDKEEISINVEPMNNTAGDRTGKVVFRLKESGYTNYLTVNQYGYDYNEDNEIILQRASGSGNPIHVVILGEGYGAESIINGEYLNRVNETMEYMFSIEPFKTYRDMFTVSTAVTLSADNVAEDIVSDKNTKFDLIFPDIETSPQEAIYKIKDYVANTFNGITGDNIDKSLIIILANYESFNGSSYIDPSGCAMAMIGKCNGVYPYDSRGLVQALAGGAAFGGLATESISHMDNIKGCQCFYCNQLDTYYMMKSRGFFENVTISGNMSDAPWRDFIFHPKYSSLVDMWEGGYNHFRGVWRSEPESVMNTYIPYYNTISRYAIYKQIMRRAGLTPSLEDFIANDKIEIPQ